MSFWNTFCDTLKGLEEHYKDFQPLAKGGMKRIFKVFDCKLNRYVAYARLHSESPEELHDPFIREARLTALLEHPNIISIHDIGIQEDNTPFFTMELKVGKNLGKLLVMPKAVQNPGQSFLMDCWRVSLKFVMLSHSLIQTYYISTLNRKMFKLVASVKSLSVTGAWERSSEIKILSTINCF